MDLASVWRTSPQKWRPFVGLGIVIICPFFHPQTYSNLVDLKNIKTAEFGWSLQEWAALTTTGCSVPQVDPSCRVNQLRSCPDRNNAATIQNHHEMMWASIPETLDCYEHGKITNSYAYSWFPT